MVVQQRRRARAVYTYVWRPSTQVCIVQQRYCYCQVKKEGVEGCCWWWMVERAYPFSKMVHDDVMARWESSAWHPQRSSRSDSPLGFERARPTAVRWSSPSPVSLYPQPNPQQPITWKPNHDCWVEPEHPLCWWARSQCCRYTTGCGGDLEVLWASTERDTAFFCLHSHRLTSFSFASQYHPVLVRPRPATFRKLSAARRQGGKAARLCTPRVHGTKLPSPGFQDIRGYGSAASNFGAHSAFSTTVHSSDDSIWLTAAENFSQWVLARRVGHMHRLVRKMCDVNIQDQSRLPNETSPKVGFDFEPLFHQLSCQPDV